MGEAASPIKSVPVALGPRSYEIIIGHDLLNRTYEMLQSRIPLHHAVVVADTNTSLYASQVADQIFEAGVACDQYSVPAGESSKSVEVLAQLWNHLLTAGTDRRSTVIAVGGGVVGDLAGFAAATFARGISVVQIPTTLLAQVDSSVGGKTGINLAAAKNIVGAFWQPQLVLIDVQTLLTLPSREFKSGLAEVIKYGMIADQDLFAQLESLSGHLDGSSLELPSIIERCCRIKARIVAADELESSGERVKLNYGHTIGHALEITCGLGTLLHGEAVSIGMHCAAQLAVARGMLAEQTVHRQQQLCESFGLPTQPPAVDIREVWEVMTHDKKADRNQVRFVLPTAVGEVELVSGIQRAEVARVLANN